MCSISSRSLVTPGRTSRARNFCMSSLPAGSDSASSSWRTDRRCHAASQGMWKGCGQGDKRNERIGDRPLCYYWGMKFMWHGEEIDLPDIASEDARRLQE